MVLMQERHWPRRELPKPPTWGSGVNVGVPELAHGENMLKIHREPSGLAEHTMQHQKNPRWRRPFLSKVTPNICPNMRCYQAS
jgi:hypothetical protein